MQAYIPAVRISISSETSAAHLRSNEQARVSPIHTHTHTHTYIYIYIFCSSSPTVAWTSDQ